MYSPYYFLFKKLKWNKGSIKWSGWSIKYETIGVATKNVPKYSSYIFATAVLLYMVTACKDSNTTSSGEEMNSKAAVITLVSGDGQSGVVGTLLEEPLIVRVDDSNGQPLIGETVSWNVVKGGGNTSPNTSKTDTEGKVQVTWTLGPVVGVHEITAEVGNLQPVLFTARAGPGPPSSIQNISGDQQHSLVETVLSEPLVIKVVDEFGNVVPHVDIEWSASGGSLESASERTDSAGTARAKWTLPAEAGRYEVQVKAGAAVGSIQARGTDFTLSCTPELVKIPRGSSVAMLCSLEPLGGFEGSASIALLDSQLPTGVNIEIESVELSTSREERTATLIRLSAEETASTAGSVTLEATSTEYDKTVSDIVYVETVLKRPEVRLIYLVPADREVHSTYPRVLERIGRHFRHWVSNQLGDGRTFSLNQIPVEVYQTSRLADSYATTPSGRDEFLWFWDNVVSDGLSLTGGTFNDLDNVWLFFIDAQNICNQIGGAATSGVAAFPVENDLRSIDGLELRQRCETEERLPGPQSRWVGGFGHELGHALGLPHPPGCDEGEPSCDSSALMWLGFVDYPDTYLREDEKIVLRLSPFTTVESVSDEIFRPEKLQDNGVYLHPAGEKSKFFQTFDPVLASSQRLSCKNPAFQNMEAKTARDPSW